MKKKNYYNNFIFHFKNLILKGWGKKNNLFFFFYFLNNFIYIFYYLYLRIDLGILIKSCLLLDLH
jgi:hypothetical protein